MGTNSTSVQFRGRDQVIAAYEAKEIASWSMWQGRAMLHKCFTNDMGEGLEALNTWINMLGTSSNAVYTLKVYEDAPGGRITDATPCDGSFNFRLNMEEQTITNVQYYVSVAELKKEVAELRQRLDADDDEPPDEDGFEKIGRIMQIPIIQAAIGKILNIEPGKLGKVSGPHSEQQLAEALVVLRKADPELSGHLWKLATMATDNPKGFRFLLTTLDNM